MSFLPPWVSVVLAFVAFGACIVGGLCFDGLERKVIVCGALFFIIVLLPSLTRGRER